ncbi:MAG: hypothetical protein KDD69_03155 [Bdellovibrionales bacterium]|nr:hypothetical protein [Bdellovibrionales bacterium]
MRRYHSSGDSKARARRRKAARVFGVDMSDRNFNDRHPLDCGKAHCASCHGDKLFGEKTPQEVRADDRFADRD